VAPFFTTAAKYPPLIFSVSGSVSHHGRERERGKIFKKQTNWAIFENASQVPVTSIYYKMLMLQYYS